MAEYASGTDREARLERMQRLDALLALQENDNRARLEDPRYAPEDFGAPAQVRFAVGNARSPQEKLQTLQKFFPLAAPTEKGDNFVYIDPESGKKVLYNEPGLDLGDVAENARTAAQMGVPAVTGLIPGVGGLARNPAGAAAISTATGEAVDYLARQSGTVDNRTPGQRVRGAVTGFAGEYGLGKFIPGAINVARKGLARPEAGAVYASAQNLGVKPTAGMVGRSAIRSAEQAGKAVPGPGGIIEGVQARAVHQTSQAVDSAADAAGNVRRGSSPAGITAKEAAGRGVVDAMDPTNDAGVFPYFRDRSSAMFKQVDQFFTPEDAVPMTSTMAIADEVSQRFGRLARTSKRELPKELIDTIKDLKSVDGQLTWQEADQLRKSIGEMIGQPGAQQEASERQLRRLYNALSTDQEAAVMAKGGQAAQLWSRGKAHRAAFERRMELLTGLTGEADPTKAYGKVVKLSAPELRALKRSMTKAEGGQQAWDDLQATVIHDMGQANPGQMAGDVVLSGAERDAAEASKFGSSSMYSDGFSPAKFATRYKQMERDGTSKIWFTGEQRKAMQDLYNVASAQKLVGAAKNFSNTAAHNFFQNLIMFGRFALVEGPAIATGMAYAMQRPGFVRWMAQGLGSKGKNVAMHLGRLSAMAARDPYLQPIADQLVEAHQAQSQQEAAAQLPPVTM